jgi:hypothetical protein
MSAEWTHPGVLMPCKFLLLPWSSHLFGRLFTRLRVHGNGPVWPHLSWVLKARLLVRTSSEAVKQHFGGEPWHAMNAKALAVHVSSCPHHAPWAGHVGGQL